MSERGARRWLRRAPHVMVLLIALIVAVLLPGAAAADQASQPASPEAGLLGAGNFHSCAVVSGAVRCWGYGGDGALGYGNTTSIGDDEAPDTVGPVDLGAGRSAVAVATGSVHTCALLDNGTVRCWGFGGNGRLGYGSTESIGDGETPGSMPPVNLGPGRTVKAITAGSGHTCAILEDDTVRCWGFNLDGRLGYGHVRSIGDDEHEHPGLSDPVKLGAGRTARAITAGGSHTCALLDNGAVRCWGFGGSGRLGYKNTDDIGRTEATTPDTAGPVNLGAGRTAVAITAGFGHTCAVLDDGKVRCWGFSGDGRLGYGTVTDVGDNEEPADVTPVDIGDDRAAKAITAGFEHTCAVLDDGSVRCWGFGGFGQLGYGNSRAIGDNEHPGRQPAVALAGFATAISGGQHHTCARLGDTSVRCWGRASTGRIGYCNEITIGDDEAPATAGPVPLGQPGIARAATCTQIVPPPPALPPPPPAAVAVVPPALPPPPPPSPAPPTVVDHLAAALDAERARTELMTTCVRAATRRRTADRRRARLFPRARAQRELRLATARYTTRRKLCVKRHGRLPGRVTQLSAKRSGAGKVLLSFRVAGTDGGRAPAARNYVVKQSTRPIRTARDFSRAAVLCRGKCAFPELTSLQATAELTVEKLVRNRLYHYAVAARDNVSSRVGPRSRTISIRAR